MIQETKIEIMQDGMTIHEGIVPDGTIAVTVMKFDFDGLMVEATTKLDKEVFLNEEIYSDQLRKYKSLIDEHIINRATKDINTCKHTIVLIGQAKRKVCTKCRYDSQERMIFLNNN